MPKVLVIVPFPFGERGLANREAQMKAVKIGPGISFDFRGVKAGPAFFDSYHDLVLADVGLFEAGKYAQEEGYDAVCIDSMSDSGMNALRSVLDIPVIAPGRSSYLVAMMLGNRFSVLTQWDPWIAMQRRLLRECGLESFCASVRSINMPPDLENLLGGKEEVVFPRLRDAALRCLEEDGADVICMGATTMHQAVPYLQQELAVPVINPGPLTYKLAELALGLNLTHSRRAYQKPREPRLELLAAMLDRGASAVGSV